MPRAWQVQHVPLSSSSSCVVVPWTLRFHESAALLTRRNMASAVQNTEARSSLPRGSSKRSSLWQPAALVPARSAATRSALSSGGSALSVSSEQRLSNAERDGSQRGRVHGAAMSPTRITILVLLVVLMAALLAVLVCVIVSTQRQGQRTTGTMVETFWLRRTRSPQWQRDCAARMEDVLRAQLVTRPPSMRGSGQWAAAAATPPMMLASVATQMAADKSKKRSTARVVLPSGAGSVTLPLGASMLGPSGVFDAASAAPTTNSPLQAALQAQWLQRKTLHASSKAGGYSFPVDFVATFVDPWDLEWRAQAAATYTRLRRDTQAAVARAKALNPNAADDAVYHEDAREPAQPGHLTTDRDELFYCVVSAIRFCPWLRCVWLVSQSPQCPRWLPSAVEILGGSLGPWRSAAGSDAHQDDGTQHSALPYAVVGGVPVVVVHHADIFDPAVTTQPTFNSCMIESQIANIPELAEHFIYSNDDMFMMRPLERRHLFTDDGVPVLAMHQTRNTILGMKSIWGTQLQLLLRIADALELPACKTPDHVALPMRKSALAQVMMFTRPLLARFKAFRSPADFPVNYLAINAVPSVHDPEVKTRYYNMGPQFAADGAAPIPHMACVNHHFYGPCFERLDAILGIPHGKPLAALHSPGEPSRNSAGSASTALAPTALVAEKHAMLTRARVQPPPPLTRRLA